MTLRRKRALKKTTKKKQVPGNVKARPKKRNPAEGKADATEKQWEPEAKPDNGGGQRH